MPPLVTLCKGGRQKIPLQIVWNSTCLFCARSDHCAIPRCADGTTIQ
jgi:hypothetical protein